MGYYTVLSREWYGFPHSEAQIRDFSTPLTFALLAPPPSIDYTDTITQPGDPEPKAQTSSTTSGNKNADSIGGGLGSSMYLILIVGALLAAAAFYVTQQK